MVTIELPDEDTLKSLIADRREKGLDKPDEVWDGRYILMPNPGNEHQSFVMAIAIALKSMAPAKSDVFPGCNVSDLEVDWTKNYRCPDVAAFLPGNPAEDRGSHWLGGPDLAVEVVSRGDRARQKLDFYASVGVKELVFIDRSPWTIDLLRVEGGRFAEAGSATPGRGAVETEVVPMRWSLGLENGDRPQLRLQSGDREWTA